MLISRCGSEDHSALTFRAGLSAVQPALCGDIQCLLFLVHALLILADYMQKGEDVNGGESAPVRFDTAQRGAFQAGGWFRVKGGITTEGIVASTHSR